MKASCKGEHNNNAKLTREDVNTIRRMAEQLMGPDGKLPWGFFSELGRLYHTHASTIWRVVKEQRWLVEEE